MGLIIDAEEPPHPIIPYLATKKVHDKYIPISVCMFFYVTL